MTAFFSRQNSAQSVITDKVYSVIERHGGTVLGNGLLTKETELDANSILAALDLLAAEGKIEITTTPKKS